MKHKTIQLYLIHPLAAFVSAALLLSAIYPQLASAAQELTLQENAAGFCSVDGSIDNNNGGFTESGFANTDNISGARIIWSVESSNGGAAQFEWRYANGGSSDRPARVLLNGESETSVDFSTTGSWTSWTTNSVSVNLKPGLNKIELNAETGQGLANIDYLKIYGDALSTADCDNGSDEEIDDPDSGEAVFGILGFATENGGTTGGQGGETVTVSSFGELKSYAERSGRYIIKVNGTLSNGSAGGQVRVASNKTLIGVGSSAFLKGIGLDIRSNNIIVRNLRMTLVGTSSPTSVNGGDIISISGGAKNIWIDHNELFSEDPDQQTDINKYDGLLDIKHQTGFITISWNYFHDHHKGTLVGSSDSDLYADRKVTFHHNYYNKVKLRIPMYRGSTGHFFNNYISGARDATEIRAGTCVRVERNYYEPLHYSIYTPTDARGSTERIDNVEVQRTSRAYPGNCSANIPYSYSSALTRDARDVKNLVRSKSGVGKI